MTYWILIFLCFSLYLLPCLPSIGLRKENKGQLTNIIIFLGLLLHASLIYHVVFAGSINLNFSNALLITSWVVVFLYWLINAANHHKGFEYLTLLPALIFLAINPIVTQHNYLTESFSMIAILHMVIALLGYSLLAFGALFSIFLLFVEKNVRVKNTNNNAFSSHLSILDMERSLFIIYWLGFFLLTVTLITGTIFTEQLFSSSLVINHKLVFSISAWIIYLILLSGRIIFGWRGKKAIKFSLVAFIFLFLSYFGSKFVIEILLP